MQHSNQQLSLHMMVLIFFHHIVSKKEAANYVCRLYASIK